MNDRLAIAEQLIEDTRMGVENGPYAEHHAPPPPTPEDPEDTVPASPEEVRGLRARSSASQCLSCCIPGKQVYDSGLGRLPI